MSRSQMRFRVSGRAHRGSAPRVRRGSARRRCALTALFRGGRTTVLTAGVAKDGSSRPPRATDQMRIASIAKAFSGAIMLQLVQQRRLGLDDTIGRRDPALPKAWARVSIRELLNHTSGVPDYTESAGFRRQAETDPTGDVPPRRIISWVARERLRFAPGSRYRYSNTDNIVVGLIAERVSRRSSASLLRTRVFGPARIAADEPSVGGDRLNAARPRRLHPRRCLGRAVRQRDEAAAAAVHCRWRLGPAPVRSQRSRVGLFRYGSRGGTVYGHHRRLPWLRPAEGRD